LWSTIWRSAQVVEPFKKSPKGLEKYIILSMFKEHYRKNNVFVSSLFKVCKTKKSFPFLPVGRQVKKTKTGAEKNASPRLVSLGLKISKEVFLFWLRRNGVESLGR